MNDCLFDFRVLYIQFGPSMMFWKIDILLPNRYPSAKKDIYLATRISISQKGYLPPKMSLKVRTVHILHKR